MPVFTDFSQPMGLHMNPDNRWIKMADRIPWDEFEIKYAELFPNFIGLPGYQEEAPFDASTLVLFRKRISSEMLMEVNEYLLAHIDDDHTPPSAGTSGGSGTAGNEGTLILDATCAPANIRYPQDVSLLNEAREKLE